MKITTLNPENTTTMHSVAFNVDLPLAPEVMAHYPSGGAYKVELLDGVLHVTVPGDTHIDSSSIQLMNTRFTEAEETHKTIEAKKRSAHRGLLMTLNQFTGVPLPENF